MEKYDIISVVGEGSYGLVMRCRHRESGQYVAIKKFLETEDDPTVRKMALREIRMLKRLRHENLVNLIEVFRRKKRFFLVFEYLEHTVLEELETRSGGLGYITSRKYIYQVVRALDFIHSHDVIHRDIKPENVLVSRLGVIKLCDFGFARLYSENETFTDYVATRWYRSPELLVGDRYGKEVDIWAVGCLYSEMMTGEPLFPGESDIDQLFQIVRILGKLSSRHQILIMRNAMFRGMKQEQNTSLIQMFPNWNRDSIDFLSQCLKMDSNGRPDTAKLLKHDLFARDNFLDNFLSELRTKLVQEMQVNPLLKRIPSYGSKNRWNNNNDEKKAAAAAVKSHTTNGGASGNSIKSTTNSLSSSQLKSSGDEKKKKMETKSNANSNGKINLSVLSTQLLQPVAVKPLQQPPTNNPTNESYSKSNSNSNLNSTNAQQQNSRTNYANNDTNNMVNINDDLTTNLAGNQRNSDESNRTTAQKQRNNNNNDENSNNLNEAANNKQTSVNNSTMTATATTTTMTTTTVAAQQFKDMQKYPIVLSAKLQSKTGDKNHYSNGITPNSNQFDFQFQPPSPIPPFQSLQTEITQLPSTELVATLLQNKRLSPAVSHMAANNLIHNSNNSNINNSFLLGGQQSLPQYFNFRRHSNVLGVADQSTNILLPKQGNQQFMNKPPSFAINPTFTTNSLHFNTRNGGAGIMIKRERDRDRSQNLIEATLKPLNGSNFQNSILNSTSIVADGNSQNASKEPSPRLLPPPQWLTGNLKMTSIHGKNSTQIGAATNAINVNGNSKRRITDWKSVGMNNAAAGPKQCTDNNNTSNSNCNIDFVLPNCPGATVSPKKSSNNNGNSTSNNNLKKKLSSLSNVTQHHHHHLHHPELSQHALITPRNFSASSDQINET